MTRQLTLIAAFLVTASCRQQAAAPANQAQDSNIVISDAPETDNSTKPADQPPIAPQPSSQTAPPVTPIATPAQAQVPSPVPPTPDNEKSATAAKKVIDAYFAALATKRFADAYRLWGGNGEASGMSLAQFTASFARYKIYDGTAFKPGTTEGAAGSIYIEFPVTVTGLLTKGGGFHLSGPMTLKRVNDVDGSTAVQRRWHIASSDLQPRR